MILTLILIILYLIAWTSHVKGELKWLRKECRWIEGNLSEHCEDVPRSVKYKADANEKDIAKIKEFLNVHEVRIPSSGGYNILKKKRKARVKKK